MTRRYYHYNTKINATYLNKLEQESQKKEHGLTSSNQQPK